MLTPEEIAAKEKLKIDRDEETKKLEERREREYELWLQGASYRQIAEQLSKSGEAITKTTVEKDIALMLGRDIKKNPETDDFFLRTRRKAVRQLEGMILPFMPGVRGGDFKKGELVLKIIDKIVDIAGAKRATKFEHDHNFDPKQLSDEELQSIADSKSNS